MSDGISPGGAPAPADSSSTPIDTGVQTPNPVNTENVPERKPDPKPEDKPSTRDAIKRATEKVEADNKAPPKPVDSKPEAKAEPAKTEAKPDAKAAEPKADTAEARQRAQDGKFAPKEGDAARSAETPSAANSEASKGEPGEVKAPQRFTTEAKAEWERTPAAVRSEVARLERENEAGIGKYRESAKHFDDIRDFHEQVTKNGGNLRATLTEVAQLEQALLSNPVQGAAQLFRRLGIDFNQVVESVTGERVGETMRQTQTQMAALHEENQKLVGIVKSMHRERQERESSEVNGQIEAFKAGKPRFDELRGTMSGLINSGLAQDLDGAYAMAERLNPGSQAPSNEIPATGSDPASAQAAPAQTRRPAASISGAPSSGSNPAARPPSGSIKESLKRAAARAT